MFIRTSMRLLRADKTMGLSSFPFRWLMGLLFLLCVWMSSALAAAPATASGQSATLLPDGHWLLVGGKALLRAKLGCSIRPLSRGSPCRSGPPIHAVTTAQSCCQTAMSWCSVALGWMAPS